MSGRALRKSRIRFPLEAVPAHLGTDLGSKRQPIATKPGRSSSSVTGTRGNEHGVPIYTGIYTVTTREPSSHPSTSLYTLGTDKSYCSPCRMSDSTMRRPTCRLQAAGKCPGPKRSSMANLADKKSAFRSGITCS
ncbi:unnamed protein product [Prorocentrum cordatum]|uniref:Uncharacterized protein n=1 Tax=Prorocentrum cordatum TaxID=2364126 RepID=A0ABN9R3D7_9DINO|nr:unnamed protein product [Polarella glacialis]